MLLKPSISYMKYLLLIPALTTTLSYAQGDGKAFYDAAISYQGEIIQILEQAPDDESYVDHVTTAAARKLLEQFNVNIRRSADAGFAPAQYLQAAMAYRADKDKNALCERLKRPEQQHLLAASIARVNLCSELFYLYDSPENARLLESLAYNLTLEDPFSDYYPFGTITSTSICFPSRKKLSPQEDSIKKRFRQLMPPSLEYHEFKAEANWILGMYKNPDGLGKQHIDEALRLGCENAW